MERAKDPIEFRIVERIAELSQAGKGWNLEINLVSWNGREPKFDIRSWDPSHERMGKGITLTADEAAKLSAALAARFASA